MLIEGLASAEGIRPQVSRMVEESREAAPTQAAAVGGREVGLEPLQNPGSGQPQGNHKRHRGPRGQGDAWMV